LSALHVAPVEISAVFDMTNGDRQLTVLADTGATHFAIDRYTLETLRSDGFYMATKTLSSPVDLSLAIYVDPELLDEGDTMKRSFVVQEVASVTHVLQLAAGPLAMRNGQMLVVEVPKPRLLLGNPDLVKLGFDVKQHLDEVRVEFHDTGFSSAYRILVSATRADETAPVIGAFTASLSLLEANFCNDWSDMSELASESDSDWSESEADVDEVPAGSLKFVPFEKTCPCCGMATLGTMTRWQLSSR
jgi:predicted aspartyl protease